MIDQNTTPREIALQEAADWLIRLTDADPQEGDIEAWNAWMEGSAVNAQAFDDIQLLWDAAAEVGVDRVLAARDASGEAATAPGSAGLNGEPTGTARAAARRPARRSRGLRWGALAAGVAALAIGVGLLRQPPAGEPLELRMSAGIGAPRHLALPDGSSVDLDAGSELVAQFSRHRRQVELVSGQAYFAVAKDPDRPFEVRADGALAQALGTHFSVARRSDSVRVMVSEGHVQVSDLRSNGKGIQNHVVQLLADQGATLAEGGPLQGPLPVDAPSSLSWLQGNVVYRSESLGNVVADLNRHSRVRIVLHDAQMARLPVTGRWSTADLDIWLESVAQALSLSIVRGPDEILLAPLEGDARGTKQ